MNRFVLFLDGYDISVVSKLRTHTILSAAWVHPWCLAGERESRKGTKKHWKGVTLGFVVAPHVKLTDEVLKLESYSGTTVQ